MKINNMDSDLSKRYIVLLENSDANSLKKIEKEFQVSITSSEDLSEFNRSFDILNAKSSVFYRNLDLVVMDEIEIAHLNKSINDSKSPIIYYEEDRVFSPVNELDLLKSFKDISKNLTFEIEKLEQFMKKSIMPLIPQIDMTWGLKTIGMENTQFTGKKIDICILDTGFDTKHPDFQGREIEGKSFVSGEDWDVDENGHGTHCAGIACGNISLDSGKKYGVAPDSNLKIAKVLAKNGKGTTSTIIDAIDWAITKKFKIISLSLGSPVKLNEPPSLIFEKAGEKALENNCIIIAAAGNDSNRPNIPKPVSCPANSKSIMAVAAIDEQLRVAKFSNAGINAATGGAINVCAPGVNILSTYPISKGKQSFLSGTSMATPFVSGLAALYLEERPLSTTKEIWQLLEKNAVQIPDSKYRDVGNGLIKTL